MDLYGLVGHPLSHSFSKKYFSEKFCRDEIDAEYVNFDLPDIDRLPRLIQQNSHMRGFNVTIPYKRAVIELLDSVDPMAREIGAVNVVRLTTDAHGNRRREGYNTDVVGFMQSIGPLLQPFHRRALILGTGGAAQAVAAGLSKLLIPYTFVSRSASRADLTYADIDEIVLQEHQIIVNATPLGTFPDVETCPDIPYTLLTPRHLCYDLVYNPARTRFLELAARQGATVENGLLMLHIQADEAWKIWNK